MVGTVTQFDLIRDVPEDQIVWRCIHCNGFDLDEAGIKHFHHQERIPCKCPPGPQALAVMSRADEIALLGGAGSMKTDATFGFILKGNAVPKGSEGDLSYTSHPHYTFLVLRRNSTDLDDWFKRFRLIGEKMGATFTENPMRCTFPSGATGYFGHLQDENSYMKYMGKEFVRIVLEEASHIPEEQTYIRILQRNRTKYTKDFDCQMMLTANPIGPGVRWLNARFRRNPLTGNIIPSGKTATSRSTGRTRMWIHSTAWDNPIWLEGNQQYLQNLQALKQFSETEYRRMALGDFDAIDGAFFPMFRRVRRTNEPENAVHIIPPRNLAPWWPRAIGVDWGFSHPTGIVWACWTPAKQMILYREAMVKGASTIEVGATIARLSLQDLDGLPGHHMAVHLSHDCFHRDGRETEAEQIKRGIDAVLGAGAAFVAAPTEEEENLGPEAAREAIARRQRAALHKTAISLLPAGGVHKRRHSFNLMRTYLRWLPLVDTQQFDMERAGKILAEFGALAYAEYRKACDIAAQEKLPILQIFDTLPKLAAGIENCQEDENDTEKALKQDGDDILDAAVHVVAGFVYREEDVPRDVFISDKLEQYKGQFKEVSTNTLVQVARAAEQQYSQQSGAGAGITFPRLGSRHRLAQMQNMRPN